MLKNRPRSRRKFSISFALRRGRKAAKKEEPLKVKPETGVDITGGIYAEKSKREGKGKPFFKRLPGRRSSWPLA